MDPKGPGQFGRGRIAAGAGLAVTSLLVLLSAGCEESGPGGGASAPSVAWVYTANYNSDTISGVAVDYSEGTIAAVGESPFATDAGPGTVLAGPQGDRLFLAARDQDTVQSFLIDDASGALDEADSAGATETPRSLAITPDGDFLFVGGLVNSEVEIWDVDGSTAQLSLEGTAPGFLGEPHAAVVDPSGSYHYSVQPNVDSVNIYEIAADGSLTDNLGPLVVGADPWAIAISADGKHVYIANLSGASVGAYSVIAATGDLSGIDTYITGNFPTGVAVTPSGDYVYVSDVSGITAFARNSSTGALTELSGSPFDAGTSPEALAIDLTGSILAVADSADNDLRVYAINPNNGQLTEPDGSPEPVGDAPQSVAIVNP